MATKVSKKPSQIQIKIGTGVSKVDISRFTRQFATMIGAGLPMVQCLEILENQLDSMEFRKIAHQIKESVQSGSTLSEALSRHKKIFDDLYVNMVEAGEIGGALDTILVRLAAYREKCRPAKKEGQMKEITLLPSTGRPEIFFGDHCLRLIKAIRLYLI